MMSFFILSFFQFKVNDLNHQLFKTWSDQYPKQVHLVSDGTTHNDNRLGAVGCMELAIKHFNISDDVIVIGGYVATPLNYILL